MKKAILVFLLAIITLGAHASTLEGVRVLVGQSYRKALAAAESASLAASMDADGRWADIDYQDKSRSLWQLEKHLDRLVVMATALANGGYADKALQAKIEKGLRHWFAGGYSNENWWYTKIGIPRRMLALAYLLDPVLTAELRKNIDRALDPIDSDDFPARPGGDRIQVITNHAKVMLWRRDYTKAANLFKKIEEEARIAPYEKTAYDAGGGLDVRNNWRPSGRGVQADLSFHHRGDRVDSSLSYGLALPEYFAYWARLLQGTGHEFSPGSINFVIDYYLDGICRHLVGGRYAEPSILNRELSRPGAGVMKPDIAISLAQISDGYRTDELNAMAAAQQGGQPVEQSYAADFFESGYFAFARPEFHSAVRYHSERNANQEAPHNSEGIRNHFRGDGACMLSVTGREYADIAPVFDFRMIPGATTAMLPYEPLSGWGELVELNSPVSFAGAIADSIYGAVGYDFETPRNDIKARKGYFFFDDEYVCLGTNISSSSPYEIVTTVEQCLSPSGNFLQDGNWYFHNGNAYHIIEGKAEGGIENRTGSWANCATNVEYEHVESNADVFSLAVSHGEQPRNGKYAYAVTPGCTQPREHSFRILANETDRQAVANNDNSLIYIIFYEPSTVETPVGSFSADTRCMVMVRNGNEIQVTDPSRKKTTDNIHIQHKQ